MKCSLFTITKEKFLSKNCTENVTDNSGKCVGSF